MWCLVAVSVVRPIEVKLEWGRRVVVLQLLAIVARGIVVVVSWQVFLVQK